MAPRSLYCARASAPLLGRAADFLRTHAADSEVVVLAPTRAAGDELALNTFERGAQGVHALTLTQLAVSLAFEEMSRRSLAPISRLGIEALSARITHTALKDQLLAYFSPVAQTPGFSRALARTITELRLERVEPNTVARTGAPGKDLARLMELYERELDRRSIADLPLILEFAHRRALSGAHRLCGLPLLLLDLTIESVSQEKLIRALAAHAPAMLATAISGEDRTLRALESILGVERESLDADDHRTTLDRVRAWLFSSNPPPANPPDGSLFFSAPGESLECVEIARRIRALAAQGLAFDRVAILLRNVEQYQPLVEEALRRASIPGYFSRGVARPDPSGRAFLALLACASDGCSASRFAEYLSLGQLPPLDEKGVPKTPEPVWVPPDDEILGGPAREPAAETDGENEDTEGSLVSVPAGWEQLLVDAAVIGGRQRWARRLLGLRREFEAQLRVTDKEDLSRRPHIERRIEQLKRLEHFAIPLIDVLAALPSAAHWGEWLEALAGLALKALRRPEPVLAVLSELQPMSEVGPASLDEVSDVLSEKLGKLRAEPPRRRYGHVFVGSIEEARGRVFDAVFLPGLAEGLFPRRALEDPLLLDVYRANVSLALDQQDNRVARERMLLRAAAAAASSSLAVCYPRMDVGQARPRVPSFYALEVIRAAEGRLPSLREFEKRATSSAPARLDWPAPSDPGVAIDDAEYDLASLQSSLRMPQAAAKGASRYLLETNPSLARSLRARGWRWRNRWTASDGLVDPKPAALAILQAHRLGERSYSPSALQNFSACPYRFLLSAIFQFRPQDAPVPLEQMDPLTRGALFHAVQFELFQELGRRDLLPITAERVHAALDLADRALDTVAARFADDLAPAIPRVWTTEVEDLRTDLRGWIQHAGTTRSQWLPLHFEFAFGLAEGRRSDPASVKDDAVILEGVHLRGSIDLIERHQTRGVLRVTDHKTGKPPERRPQYVGGGAILQPLLYALAAERLLGQPVESGGLFFCTQRGDFSEFTIPLNDDARSRLARVLKIVEQFVSGGFLPAAPQRGACKLCDYRPVCGPYEEQRSQRKLPERLEPLIEIRNLP